MIADLPEVIEDAEIKDGRVTATSDTDLQSSSYVIGALSREGGEAQGAAGRERHVQRPSGQIPAVVAVAIPTAMPMVTGSVVNPSLNPDAIEQVDALLALTCCCTGCLSIFNILYIGLGLTIIVLNADARESCTTIWSYCVFAIAACAVSTCVGVCAAKEVLHTLRRVRDPSLPPRSPVCFRPNQVLSMVFNLVFFCWGCQVWDDLHGTCRRETVGKYRGLYSWYAVTFSCSVVYVIRLCAKILLPRTAPQRGAAVAQNEELRQSARSNGADLA